MPSSKHIFDKIDDMMMEDNNDEMKKLEDIINDLTLVVGMYIRDYPFDDDHKVKQQILVNYAHLMIDTPINTRGMAKGVGVEYVGNDLVEVILTEQQSKHAIDILQYLIDKCNYQAEIEHMLHNVINQINSQIEYEPSNWI
jgi:predicted transcriptional regulator with HTH domain